jgi:8-hydroxy-5-deazaflavin:NADPH oxidoreductase
MRIGIVGAGMIGGTLARLCIQRGHDVFLANSTGPHTLAQLAAELGADLHPATVAEAARGNDLVVLAIPLGACRTLPAGALTGRIVVDATNYYEGRDGTIAELEAGTVTSSELIAAWLQGALVVKAFNTLAYTLLRDEARAEAPLQDRLAIPLAGDDPPAKRTVAALIQDIGFTPVDGGRLADGRHQQPGTPVYNVPANAAQVLALLSSSPERADG